MALTPFIYMPSDPKLGIHMVGKQESIKKYRGVWRAIRSAARNSRGRKTENIRSIEMRGVTVLGWCVPSNPPLGIHMVRKQREYRGLTWHCSVGAAHKVHIFLEYTVSVPSSELGPPTPSPPCECVLPSPEPNNHVHNFSGLSREQ